MPIIPHITLLARVYMSAQQIQSTWIFAENSGSLIKPFLSAEPGGHLQIWTASTKNMDANQLDKTYPALPQEIIHPTLGRTESIA